MYSRPQLSSRRSAARLKSGQWRVRVDAVAEGNEHDVMHAFRAGGDQVLKAAPSTASSESPSAATASPWR